MRHTNRVLTDEQWERIAPYLPEHRPSPKGGRPRANDRECLEGTLSDADRPRLFISFRREC